MEYCYAQGLTNGAISSLFMMTKLLLVSANAGQGGEKKEKYLAKSIEKIFIENRAVQSAP